MNERFGGGIARLAAAKVLHDFVMAVIDLFAVLTFVCEKGGLLFLSNRGDIYVIGGMEVHGLRSQVHFVVIELERVPSRGPGAERQQTRRLMIGMRVDGPLREDDIGLLDRNQFRERLCGRAIDDSRAIDLAREYGFRAKNLTGRNGFGRSRGRRFIV